MIILRFALLFLCVLAKKGISRPRSRSLSSLAAGGWPAWPVIRWMGRHRRGAGLRPGRVGGGRHSHLSAKSR